MSKIHDIKTYAFSRSDKIFVDANVWLHFFPAPSAPIPGFAQSYSQCLCKILSVESSLISDLMIISEYVNTYCRCEWNAFKDKYDNRDISFKDFRKSDAFISVGKTSSAYAKKIYSMVKIYPNSPVDFDTLFNGYKSGMLDFNDAVFVELCRKNGYKMLTNDADFKDSGIEILTSNPRLLIQNR